MKNAVVLLVASIPMYGCAYYQKVTLLEESEGIKNLSNIEIVDNRDANSRKTHVEINPFCARWYGDEFIAPSKIEYLKHELSTVYDKSSKLKLVIDIYDTVEYCVDAAARSSALASAAAVSAVTSSSVSYGVSGDTGGDYFRLNIVGQANGHDLYYAGEFEYYDLSYVNFPSENKEYRNRIKALFEEAAKYIVSVEESGDSSLKE